jgi:hypothetical protein
MENTVKYLSLPGEITPIVIFESARQLEKGFRIVRILPQRLLYAFCCLALVPRGCNAHSMPLSRT